MVEWHHRLNGHESEQTLGVGDVPFVCDGEGNGNPFQYSCLENSMDGGGLKATVHGVAKIRT